MDIPPRQCPICGEQASGTCRCGHHDADALRNGHGARCDNGHRWTSRTADGHTLVIKNQHPVK